jgi:hypothetical protein
VQSFAAFLQPPSSNGIGADPAQQFNTNGNDFSAIQLQGLQLEPRNSDTSIDRLLREFLLPQADPAPDQPGCSNWMMVFNEPPAAQLQAAAQTAPEGSDSNEVRLSVPPPCQLVPATPGQPPIISSSHLLRAADQRPLPAFSSWWLYHRTRRGRCCLIVISCCGRCQRQRHPARAYPCTAAATVSIPVLPGGPGTMLLHSQSTTTNHITLSSCSSAAAPEPAPAVAQPEPAGAPAP